MGGFKRATDLANVEMAALADYGDAEENGCGYSEVYEDYDNPPSHRILRSKFPMYGGDDDSILIFP